MQILKESAEFLIKLEQLASCGIQLYLNGVKASPEEILLGRGFEDETNYMADFVMNDAGQIKELRYDRVMDF